MKTNNTISRFFLTVVFVMTACSAAAQMKTSYFMEGSVPRYDMNAALTPMHSYLNLPLIPLGSLGVNVNNNFLSVHNFIYPHNGGHVTFLHESVNAKKFLRKIPRTASINTDLTYNLLGMGMYSKRHDFFWSFGWNIRSVTDVGIPKDVFRIVKSLKNGNYDISDLSVNSMAYSEFVFGFTKPVNWHNLVVGGRFKFIMGGGHAEARFNNVTLAVTPDEVLATFGGKMRGSMFGMQFNNLKTDEDGNIDLDDVIDFDRFRVGDGFRSYGAAIDIGAEMKFLDDRLKVSFALNDLGFIKWSGKNSFQADLDDVVYGYKGYNWDEDDWQTVKPEGDVIKLRQTGTKGYSKRLSTTMNIGAEYTFLDNLLGVGVLSHSKFSNKVNYTELTVIGTVRPRGDWFTASVSHSLIHNSIGIFGLAFNFHPRAVNFFLGVDYIPVQFAEIIIDGSDLKTPLRGKSASFYIGLAFTPGRKWPSKKW